MAANENITQRCVSPGRLNQRPLYRSSWSLFCRERARVRASNENDREHRNSGISAAAAAASIADRHQQSIVVVGGGGGDDCGADCRRQSYRPLSEFICRLLLPLSPLLSAAVAVPLRLIGRERERERR